MNEKIRMRKLLIALNEYMDSFSYYDEEADETVIDGDENECYDVLMRDDELHLLGAETVKEVIHICFVDWEKFDELCRRYRAY